MPEPIARERPKITPKTRPRNCLPGCEGLFPWKSITRIPKLKAGAVGRCGERTPLACRCGRLSRTFVAQISPGFSPRYNGERSFRRAAENGAPAAHSPRSVPRPRRSTSEFGIMTFGAACIAGQVSNASRRCRLAWRVVFHGAASLSTIRRAGQCRAEIRVHPRPSVVNSAVLPEPR
jgi:hypothetical protein